MVNQYREVEKVIPGRVANSFRELFGGNYGFNTNYVKATRVDCASFKIESATEEMKIAPIIGGGDIICGVENLEEKLRRTISTGNPSEIIVQRIHTGLVDEYTIYMK